MPNWFWSYSLINLKMKRKKGSWWIKNTTSIPPVYHKGLYRFGSGILFSHGGAMKLFQFQSQDCFVLHCIALHCIALHCSVWSAFQFKADSTEIYESSMNLFLLVFSLTCISIKTRQHWDLRELCFCFSAWNAFQFVTTVCTS